MKFRKRGRSRRPRAFFSIAWPIIAFSLAVWVCLMGLITESVKTDLKRQMQQNALEFATTRAPETVNLFTYPGITKDSPGIQEVSRIINANHWLYMAFYADFDPTFPFFYEPANPSPKDRTTVLLNFDFAVNYSNVGGQHIHSGHYLCFPYMSVENWNAKSEQYEGLAYIDMESLDLERVEKLTETARLTGYFVGNEFIPTCIESVYGLEYKDPNLRERLSWRVARVNPQPAEQETVTLYTADLCGTGYTEKGPVTVDGVTYDHLLDLIQHQSWYNKTLDLSSGETIHIATNHYFDRDGSEIYVTVGFHVTPMPYILDRLAPFYGCSFLIMAVAVGLYLWFIRRNLITPLTRITKAAAANSPLSQEDPKCWHEPRFLQENYAAAQQAAHESQIEITQLRTALEYAQNAEAHRRQMISNITHELKTPLAVIHSYAEGLRDGIAADKQDQYLNVILEESQRMDAMVLEMLDLSRLEAGKVRLASDQFSLLKLTRSIFDKLEPLSKEKNLQIEYDLVEEFQITADEGRIGQVITNFATNAIKYTPAGGTVWIKVFRHNANTIFSIENQCEPLSEEALNHVWDSFYRVEQSRTTKGTGLGLTIAKAIIELHGGTCRAINTSTGVEFRFMLP